MTVLGIDIGGTRIKYGVVKDGILLSHGDCETPRAGYQEVLSTVGEIITQLRREHPEAERIGLAVPGVIDVDAGIVRYSNNLGWHNVPIRDDLTRITGLPVRAANDAHCATLGETVRGAGKGFNRVAMLTLGTGVGGGFVRDGKLETDPYGAMAYIFGHSAIAVGGRACNCGRAGCLETYASASALKAGMRAANIPGDGAKELFDLYRQGDPKAKQLVENFLADLNAGAVNVANILRPQILIIGGGVAGASDVILPCVRQALEKEVYGYEFAPVLAVPAMLGNTAGILGAAEL